jgi:pantothenate kinase
VPVTTVDLPAAVARAAEFAARPGRALLGVAGAPGAGKSTLSAAIAAEVPGVVVVPMDGFHLTTAVLEARHDVERRGAIDTFDAPGYVALLRRLRAGEAVRAPGFDRSREEPVPEAITVPADVPLVVTEGNYLLVDEAPWSEVPRLLDETWFVATSVAPGALRRLRLGPGRGARARHPRQRRGQRPARRGHPQPCRPGRRPDLTPQATSPCGRLAR